MAGTGGRERVRLLTESERVGMRSELSEVVEYRKSGLSLNWIVGCPLDCGYCVRHLFDNFAMKVPRALTGEEEAVALLTGHRFFRPHVTPIQLLNRATDPLPNLEWCWPTCRACDLAWRHAEGIPPYPRPPDHRPTALLRLPHNANRRIRSPH